jgi:hypothetical protein
MEKSFCQYCEKIIDGSTSKQVDYLMTQHLMSKHPEKILSDKDKNKCINCGKETDNRLFCFSCVEDIPFEEAVYITNQYLKSQFEKVGKNG